MTLRLLNDFPVVLTGVAVAGQSALTPKGSFIIPDWMTQVVRVYKNTSPIAISAPQSITWRRAGGSLTVGYLELVAKDGDSPDFQLQRTYLLR